ncbi:unannotated protein [freshwater metagenome]|uniref:Unannotated protein n=1 Tax=freshwater metagenome TaxID=449393 RepID=A0A6J5ZXD9_9ZZZZ|nr:sulfatase-like hydrolase/transferase [Actinomycetota bacterium]
MSKTERPPNLILLITDQQRAVQHWPDDQQWLDELTPNDAALRATGVDFTRAFTATAMCSPSRASFLTGTYPSRHGVTLTLVEGAIWPNTENAGASLPLAVKAVKGGAISFGRMFKSLARSLSRIGPKSGNEPELPPGIATLATMLGQSGYHVALRGKWHLTKPVNGTNWTDADGERIERDYGFAGWEPPDAGGDTFPETFGGGKGGPANGGWDKVYMDQVERFLAQEDLPEPFCLVVSLINPHDVLAYPTSFRVGGYRREEFADLDIPLPPTIDESLANKPAVHSMALVGMAAYLGPLVNRDEQRDYVNFYAHLQRVVDRHVGRLLGALGDVDDPTSLRSRTVIARTSDHGDMGLSHGGARQKIFNAYEETIRVPLVFSNPVCFPKPAKTDTLASLIDLVPTFLGIAGATTESQLDGRDLTPVLASFARPDEKKLKQTGVDFGAVVERDSAVDEVRDHILFTYDDHQSGTAMQNGAGQPNRVRCVRDERWKYAVYLDPDGVKSPEYELYDLESDPDEAYNLLDTRTGRPRSPRAVREQPRLAALLIKACEEAGMTTPALPVA